ncbi:MAG TPA: DnaB-like helicase N-terminal domain-containing protein, partial [Methyloceanibacter sp.]|nr:DnaB-like helicase N-terminal domain-containing protein [Methyloceanibacter sp.]
MTNALIRPVASAPETPTFRAQPHNLEAEQALLGAILVNNEACDRVSSFLKPEHFYDALHGRIYDHASKLIWAGKRATPITLKTFFQGDEPAGDLSVPQYLGRLAANATTIINAEDYGRTIYDLATRRDLIQIGETMVNVAYEAPVDFAPQT